MTIGQKVQLTPGGPVYRVARINSRAAYLSRKEPREVVKHTREGEEVRFTAQSESTIAVRPNAFLYYPEEEETC